MLKAVGFHVAGVCHILHRSMPSFTLKDIHFLTEYVVCTQLALDYNLVFPG